MPDNGFEQRWRKWIDDNIGGDETAQSNLVRQALRLAAQGTSGAEIAKFLRSPLAHDTLGNEPHTISSPRSNKDDEYRGIMDIVASDKSELGRSTLAALNAVELKAPFTAKSFYVTRGFRIAYGFDGRKHKPPFTAMLLLIAFVAGLASRFVPQLFYLMLAAVLLATARCALAGVLTPLFARQSALIISNSRLVINFGVLGRKQIVAELHWIREVSWSQTFLQKLLNVSQIEIELDNARGKQPSRIILPGITRVDETQTMVDKLRNVSQKLRQGNYYARSFIG